MSEIKLIDRIDHVSRKKGNGLLRREVWVDSTTKAVTRYNLAYVNHKLFSKDNGRVLGYDNRHGHHRHFMGTIEPVDFKSYEDIETRFEQEWLALRGQR